MLAIIIIICLLCPGKTDDCLPCLPCEPCRSVCDLDDLFSAKSVDAVSAETGLSERELSTLSIYTLGAEQIVQITHTSDIGIVDSNIDWF